jgi:hypothetical protein
VDCVPGGRFDRQQHRGRGGAVCLVLAATRRDVAPNPVTNLPLALYFEIVSLVRPSFAASSSWDM